MEQRLEELLKRGKESLRRRDRKTYVSLNDIQYLIGQGAVIETNNRRQEGGVYLQEVVLVDKFGYVTTTTRKVMLQTLIFTVPFLISA